MSFPVKRCQRHAKVNFGDDGKRETSNHYQPFAVNEMLKVLNNLDMYIFDDSFV